MLADSERVDRNLDRAQISNKDRTSPEALPYLPTLKGPTNTHATPVPYAGYRRLHLQRDQQECGRIGNLIPLQVISRKDDGQYWTTNGHYHRGS